MNMDCQPILTELIAKLSRYLAGLEAEAVSGLPEEMTLHQFYYLDVIHSLPQPTVSSIAQYRNLAKPTVTVAIKQLEEKGYVHKERTAADKRVTLIHLTEQGRTMVAAHSQVHATIAQRLIAQLEADEIKQLVQILTKLFDE